MVAALKKLGLKNKAIAEAISSSESTIRRELERNSGKRGYRPKQGHRKALLCKLQSGQY